MVSLPSDWRHWQEASGQEAGEVGDASAFPGFLLAEAPAPSRGSPWAAQLSVHRELHPSLGAES